MKDKRKQTLIEGILFFGGLFLITLAMESVDFLAELLA